MNVAETVRAYGPESVSYNSLVAMALGISEEKLMGIVGDITMRNLLTMSIPELKKRATPGLANRILALGEVMRRQRMVGSESRPVINSPQDLAALLMDEMRYLDREHFRAVFLNTKNGVLKVETISIGSLNSSLVHPRELFKAAVRESANNVILVHNHPSGDPTPSREDVGVTKRLCDAGKLMGIEVLDHVIIGDGRYVSLKERGNID